MPNKEGGYAPNYNPVAAVDGASGMIVDADVLNEMSEGETVIPTVERIEAAFGQKPEQFLADSTFATGAHLRVRSRITCSNPPKRDRIHKIHKMD
jgi:hypothetical protein